MNLYKKLRNMKMLLIDDDAWIRDSLSIFFESEGCHLKALETAEEGLKALKKQPYDIIIVDYREWMVSIFSDGSKIPVPMPLK